MDRKKNLLDTSKNMKVGEEVFEDFGQKKGLRFSTLPHSVYNFYGGYRRGVQEVTIRECGGRNRKVLDTLISKIRNVFNEFRDQSRRASKNF